MGPYAVWWWWAVRGSCGGSAQFPEPCNASAVVVLSAVGSYACYRIRWVPESVWPLGSEGFQHLRVAWVSPETTTRFGHSIMKNLVAAYPRLRAAIFCDHKLAVTAAEDPVSAPSSHAPARTGHPVEIGMLPVHWTWTCWVKVRSPRVTKFLAKDLPLASARKMARIGALSRVYETRCAPSLPFSKIVWFPFLPLPAPRAGDVDVQETRMARERWNRMADAQGVRPYAFSGGWAGRDYPMLFRAVAALDLDLRLFPGGDGQRAAQVRRACAAAGMAPHRCIVRPAVSRTEYAAAMRDAVFVVVPIIRGAGKLVNGLTSVAEAILMGKAVVVSDPANVYEGYIDDGLDGFRVPPGDEATLRRSMQTLLACAHNGSLAELERRVLARVRRLFTAEALTARLGRLLTEWIQVEGPAHT